MALKKVEVVQGEISWNWLLLNSLYLPGTLRAFCHFPSSAYTYVRIL